MGQFMCRSGCGSKAGMQNLPPVFFREDDIIFLEKWKIMIVYLTILV